MLQTLKRTLCTKLGSPPWKAAAWFNSLYGIHYQVYRVLKLYQKR